MYIEADNALKLHKLDANYIYKLDIITEDIVNEIEYHKMIFKIPSNYTIPKGLEFKFKEHYL